MIKASGLGKRQGTVLALALAAATATAWALRKRRPPAAAEPDSEPGANEDD